VAFAAGVVATGTVVPGTWGVVASPPLKRAINPLMGELPERQRVQGSKKVSSFPERQRKTKGALTADQELDRLKDDEGSDHLLEDIAHAHAASSVPLLLLGSSSSASLDRRPSWSRRHGSRTWMAQEGCSRSKTPGSRLFSSTSPSTGACSLYTIVSRLPCPSAGIVGLVQTAPCPRDRCRGRKMTHIWPDPL
jgi:hypothetical protein